MSQTKEALVQQAIENGGGYRISSSEETNNWSFNLYVKYDPNEIQSNDPEVISGIRFDTNSSNNIRKMDELLNHIADELTDGSGLFFKPQVTEDYPFPR